MALRVEAIATLVARALQLVTSASLLVTLRSYYCSNCRGRPPRLVPQPLPRKPTMGKGIAFSGPGLFPGNASTSLLQSMAALHLPDGTWICLMAQFGSHFPRCGKINRRAPGEWQLADVTPQSVQVCLSEQKKTI